MKKLTFLTLSLALLAQACNPYSAHVPGLPVQKSLPNGVTANYGYDDLDRLTNITQQKGAALLASYAYTLDDAGNRLGVAEAGGDSIQWTYDNLYRLTGETRKSGGSIVAQSSFTYDLAGNRLTQNVNGSLTSYTYNELDQMLTAGSIHYQYDGRGNLAKEIDGSQITQYEYDAANRLASVSLPNGTNITNAYDADGRRVQQSVNPSTGSGQASQVTKYLWDETSLYGDVVLETTGSNTTSYTLAGTDLISQTRNGGTSYYLQDGQGSTRNLTDSTGSITDSYSYMAFGEIYNQTGTTANNYLYTGQQYDAQTELYNLRARYYSPAVGRFLSQDTYAVNFNNPIELNRYGYTANNPINASDPSGNYIFAQYSGKNADNLRIGPFILKPIGAFVGAVFILASIYALMAYTPVGDIVRDLPQEKTLEQLQMEAQWAEYLRLRNQSQNQPTPQAVTTVFPPFLPRTPYPQPTPTQESGCDSAKFESWWMSLPPVPGSYQPGQDWYQYEQRVARAGGLYGDYARRIPTGPVDADGIEPSTCRLADGKYITNTDLYEQWNKTGTSPWKGYSTELLRTLQRYLNAIQISDGIPGAQPSGLIIRINKEIARRYFEDHLREAGFALGVSGFVEIWP